MIVGYCRGFNESAIRIWNYDSGDCDHTLKQYIVTDIKQIKDNQIVSASADASLKIWDYQKGECISTIQGDSRTGWFKLAVIPNTKLIVSAYSDIKLWNYETGSKEKTISRNSYSKCRSVIVISNTKYIVCGTSSNIIEIWNY